jgi:HK97 family phage portal protein
MIGFVKKFLNAIKTGGGNPQAPQYWLKKLFGANTTISGMEMSEDIALKYSAVWAAVNIISGAVGFLPLLTHKRVGEGKERAVNHKVYDLLKTRPNPYMDSHTFKEVLQAHALLWGNGYAEIEYDNRGTPIALWPLLPNQTEPKVVDGKLTYVVHQTNGDVSLSYTQVLHLKGLGFDGIRGYPVIQYAAENIALGMAAEKNAAAFFGNDSSPTGVLTTDTALKLETKNQIEQAWEEKHKGLDKKYRIAVLHSGLKWQQMGVDAKSAQLLESRKFGINDIARWFNIPPHMLADLDRATFSNIEEQGINFVMWTLNKWLIKWSLECDYKLFNAAERKIYFTEFLTDALLRGNTESRYKAYQIGLGGNNNPGFITINEVRSKENLPPDPDGNKLFMPNYGGQKDLSAVTNSAWQRIITKETKALRKALKKPEQFLQWADEFYAKHKEFAIAVLKPIFQVSAIDDFEAVVASYINGHKAELKEAFELNDTESLLTEWEKGACND